MNLSKISARIAIVAAAIFATLCMQAQTIQKSNPAVSQQQTKLVRVFQYLNTLYVDETDMAPLVEEAIKSMLAELDPHSTYLTAEELRGVQEQFAGEFSGIGVEYNMHRDTILVINVVSGAPAESVGVRPNDRIVKIDGENAVGFSRNDVLRKLRGKNGTKVSIEVVRHGTEEPLQFVIERGKIPINTVSAYYLINKDTGYIKVNRFGNTTMSEFEKAFSDMGNIKSLVLDLRGNGGGIMDQAVRMAEFFLPSGSLIVSTEGAHTKPQQKVSLRNGRFTTGSLVVLVDQSSASSSEIVAGALQDWDRAVIIGSPSFGKGLVQRQIVLPDSSAVRITIARYHTPTGRVIQRPYEKGKRDEYYAAHRERLSNGDSDSTAADLPAYKTLRNHRTVYGGGGITPDLVIETDTTLVTDCVVKLTAKGLILDFLYHYIDKSREELAAKYKTFSDLDKNFEVPSELMDQLLASAAEKGIECADGERAGTERYIKRLMKAYVARTLFTNNEYWRVLNETEDRVYNTAVEVIGDKKRMTALLN